MRSKRYELHLRFFSKMNQLYSRSDLRSDLFISCNRRSDFFIEITDLPLVLTRTTCVWSVGKHRRFSGGDCSSLPCSESVFLFFDLSGILLSVISINLRIISYEILI